MFPRGYDRFDYKPDPHAPRWPLYVRILAVAYVLSHAVQFLAFVGLVAMAGVLYSVRRELDAQVVGLAAGGIGTLVLCVAFRRWFVAWGRRNYPDGKPTSSDDNR